MRRPDDREFTQLVAARSLALRRMAYLMCGDWSQAEDLVQVAFIKLHAAWGRVRTEEGVDAYLRTTLLRACIDEKRRAHWRREQPSSEAMPDVAAVHDSAVTRMSDRDVVVAALRRLPPGQRAGCRPGSAPSWSCASSTTRTSRPRPGCSASPPAPSRARPREVWRRCARSCPTPLARPARNSSR